MNRRNRLVVHPDNSVHLILREGALPRGMSTHEVKQLAVEEFLAGVKTDIAGTLLELLQELGVDMDFESAPRSSRKALLAKRLTTVVDRLADDILRT